MRGTPASGSIQDATSQSQAVMAGLVPTMTETALGLTVAYLFRVDKPWAPT
jgi:hypothetical protein